MTSSTLEMLIAEAQASKEDPTVLEAQVAKEQAKCFSVAQPYEDYTDQLLELVEPLRTLLPNVAEYETFAAAHDDKPAGVTSIKDQSYSNSAKRLYLKNPAYIMLTQARRSETMHYDMYHELSNDEYTEFLDTVDAMCNWWEQQPSASPLDLAKSIIVQSVLENDALRAMVLPIALKNVDRTCQLNRAIEVWREE